MTSRWEHLLDLKPRPILDHLVDEVAKLFAAELGRWPLEVSELDPSAAPALARFLRPDAPAPGAVAWTEAFRLARWDLEREFDAYDDYMRNQRWVEAGLEPDARALLLFLSRFITEQLLSLTEATQGRIDKGRRIDVLERTHRRLKAAWA